MADFEFEGEISSVSKTQQEYIIKVLNEKGYKDGKIRIEPVGKAGDNFVANVKRIIVDTSSDVFKMIAKIAPCQEIARAAGIPMWFKNESVIYGEVFPKFMKLQNDEEIETKYQFRVPKCYGILTEEPNELILLEDLEINGFAMQDKVKPLTNEYVRIILKNFAIYHSLSYVWRNKNPEMFEASAKHLFDLFSNMSKMPGFDQYLGSVLSNSITIINDSEYGRIYETITKQWPQMLEKLSIEGTSKYAVFIHGDAWINNFMFKEQDGQLDCIPIDYQQTRLDSPACDFLHVIFTSTDHPTRHKHFYEWADYYHSELDKCLSNFGLKSNFIYPKDQFDADIRRYSKAYFVVGYLMFAIMFIKPETAAIFQELKEKGKDMSEILESASELLQDLGAAELRSRLVGLVDSYKEFGFVDF